MSKNSNESPRLTAEEVRRKRNAIRRLLGLPLIDANGHDLSAESGG